MESNNASTPVPVPVVLTNTEKLIEAAFLTGAIQIKNPTSAVCPTPFQIDIQKLIRNHDDRNLLIDCLFEKYKEITFKKEETIPTILLGMTFEGIPPAILLAQKLGNFSFIAMKKGSEKIHEEDDLQGSGVLIITGQVITGKELSEVAHATYASNGVCTQCITLFSHESTMATMMFDGEIKIENGGKRSGSFKKLPEVSRTITSLINPSNILDYIENNIKEEVKNRKITFEKEEIDLIKNWMRRNGKLIPVESLTEENIIGEEIPSENLPEQFAGIVLEG